MSDVTRLITKEWKQRLERLGPLISDEDVEKICISLLTSRGEAGAKEEELNKLIDWAAETVVNSSLLDGVLDGKMLIDLVDGEPSFKLSDEGTKHAEEIITELDK